MIGEGLEGLPRPERQSRLMLQNGKPRLCDLYVMLWGIEARADTAYHLAIDDDRQASLHFDEIMRRNKSDTAVIYGILECFAQVS